MARKNAMSAQSSTDESSNVVDATAQTKQRRRFDADARKRILATARESSVAQAAKDNGISKSIIYAWQNEAGKESSRVAKRTQGQGRTRTARKMAAPVGRNAGRRKQAVAKADSFFDDLLSRFGNKNLQMQNEYLKEFIAYEAKKGNIPRDHLKALPFWQQGQQNFGA